MEFQSFPSQEEEYEQLIELFKNKTSVRLMQYIGMSLVTGSEEKNGTKMNSVWKRPTQLAEPNG